MAVINKIEKRGNEASADADVQALERMWQMEPKAAPSNLFQYLADRRFVWEKYWSVLKSQELLIRLNKRWNSYGKALRLRYFLLQDAASFENEKLKALKGSEKEAGIEANNPRLANALRKFSPAQENAIPILGALLAALNANPEFAKSYLQTHGAELVNWVNLLKEDDKLKDKLRKLVIEISGAEAAEIDRCIGDLQSWKDFRIGNNIMFFWNRVMVYLQGGKLEKQNFLGLIRYFKDKQNLVTQINKSNALKSLLTYKRQVDFFVKWIAIVKDAMPKGRWEGFSEKDGQGNEFYPNLMGGERFIELFRKKFGNTKFADRMEALHTNETPSAWYAELNLQYKRLVHPSYQNAHIILPASEELTEIFSQRRKELTAGDINAKLRELAAILRNLFKDAKRKSANLREFEALLLTELGFLRKETRAEKIAFTNALLDYGEPVLNFVEENASWVENKNKAINSYIGAYVYLTRAKLETLRRRIGRAINPFSFEADERVIEDEKKIRKVQNLGVLELKNQAKEIQGMGAALKERMAQAAVVDEILKRAAPSYFTKNGISISEPEYF
ncbi:hypothetical protein HYV80_06255 [Candidatus Woesearchaeota archaeon]|nr:hypothetical protein [Candidatus Woesearchaeota archaeon]